MSEKNIKILGAMIEVMESSQVHFGRLHKETFEVCTEVIERMKDREKKKPKGRKALVEHTKRKIEDEE